MPPISFARGAPTPECIDAALISDCAQAALARDGVAILSYGQGGGYGPLRQLLADEHGVDPSRVFVTTGGLQGFVFYSAVQLQRKPGRVIVEAPTYDRPLKLLAWQGAEVVAIPQDDEGLDLDALEAELKRGGDISFVYTIPTFQNPSGRTLGARASRAPRRAGEAATGSTCSRTTRTGRCATTASPSPRSTRSRAADASRSPRRSRRRRRRPGLRVGWFVVPDEMKGAFDDRASSTYISPSLLPQAIIHELHARGAFETNLARVNALLRRQKDAMLEALAREMPEGVIWSKPDGGYFLWIDFGPGVDSAELLRQCDRGRRHVREGHRLLPERLGRPDRRALRVQLRVARAHRRGRPPDRAPPSEG